ncbi:DUF4304 domain-containing protein [Microvirga sp. TS319]|uniref:DUF4304 domain-containing protein n=1 Tax=Microvirga sp. TS319 TaxID=3241165 RepID=UPI00351A41E8
MFSRKTGPHFCVRCSSGAFPNLRREHNGVVELITFQSDRHGSALMAELAKCHMAGINHPTLGHIPASQVTAQTRHPLYRKRIGAPASGQEGLWFDVCDQGTEAAAQAIWSYLADGNIWSDLSPDGSEAPYR